MTIAMAWVGTRGDGQRDLYFASDSRMTGGGHVDICPKILTLPRSDCAMVCAGEMADGYALMIQFSHSINAHVLLRNRSLDIAETKTHLLKLFNDFMRRYEDRPTSGPAISTEFIFGGYSWRQKDFRIWRISFRKAEGRFIAQEARTFHPKLLKACFIGDQGRSFASSCYKLLAPLGSRAPQLEPLMALAERLQKPAYRGTIGGSPQVVRITESMNTEAFCIDWKGETTLFGRPLFGYETAEHWVIDPIRGRFLEPRIFSLSAQPSLNGTSE